MKAMHTCRIPWCCAQEHTDGLCAVHMAVKEFKPLDTKPRMDYWAELDAHWDSLHGAGELAREPEPVKPACEYCEDGDCPCCKGNGYLDCRNYACDEQHDCETCNNTGKCQRCGGTGIEGAAPRPKTKRGTAADDLPEETRQWLANRPSQRRAA